MSSILQSGLLEPTARGAAVGAHEGEALRRPAAGPEREPEPPLPGEVEALDADGEAYQE